MMRLSSIEDYEDILQISKESFLIPWSENEYFKIYDYDSYQVYVYEVEQKVCAYAIFYFPYGNEEVELLQIAVAPYYRNQKIAKAFLEEVLLKLQKRNYLEVFLEVSSENKVAYKLYQNLGFEVIAVRKDYYSKNTDAYVMRKRF